MAGLKEGALSWSSSLGWASVRWLGQEAGWRPGMASKSSLSFFPSPDPNPAEALDLENKGRPRRDESACSVVLEKTLYATLAA